MTERAQRTSLIFFGSTAGHLRVVALTLFVLSTCAGLAWFVDRPLALATREGLDKATREAFIPITNAGKADFYILFAVLAYGLGRFGMVRAAPLPVAEAWHRLSRAGSFFLVSLALSAVLVHTLKLAVGRARPKALFQEGFYGAHPFAFDLHLNSFPSGHSQTVWTFATVLMILFPRGWPLFVAWAGSISASRIIVGAHFSSDVLMGSFIAVMSALYVRHKWYGDLTRPHFGRYIQGA